MSPEEKNETAGSGQVGAYEILGPPVAKGGSQGRIFRARCMEPVHGLEQGHIVALKEMHTPFEGDKLIKRAKKIVEVLKENPHPGIVGYHDFFIWEPGTFSERQCVIMEFLEGQVLSEKLESSPRGLPWEEAQSIFRVCLEALCHAKKHGIIHRDLKPSNIFICNQNDTKKESGCRIIDFEIARHDSETQSTQTGLHGSFDYMAPDFHPEQMPSSGFRGDEISDLFSYCVCFYETLTGQLPFKGGRGEGAQSFFERSKEESGHKLRLSRSAFTPISGLKEFLAKGLSFKREDRFQSFQEMIQAFNELGRERIQGPDEQYELIKWIGRGGFAEVLKAKRLSDNELVALKCLRRDQYASQFTKEARLLATCRDPHVVTCLDFFKLENIERYFLVMEYLPNMPADSLRGRIKSSSDGLPADEVIQIFSGYLKALQTLHEQYNIIHRDIKPSNLYAPENKPEKAKLLDLGIARDLTGTMSVGPVPGTFEYMAPEFGTDKQARGTPQSDIFSLALCLYEALTGKKLFPPLPRKPLGATMAAFFERCATPPEIEYTHSVFTKWPNLRIVIAKSFSFDPKHRYRTAAEFNRALLLAAGIKDQIIEEAYAAEDEDDIETQYFDPSELFDAKPVDQPKEKELQKPVSKPDPVEVDPGIKKPKKESVRKKKNTPHGQKTKPQVEKQSATPINLKPLALTALAAMFILGSSYGYFLWNVKYKHTVLQKINFAQNSDIQQQADTLVHIREWAFGNQFLPKIGINLSPIHTEIQAKESLFLDLLKRQTQQDPVETWGERLTFIKNEMESEEVRGLIGENAHKQWSSLVEENISSFRAFKGLVDVRVVAEDESEYENLVFSITSSNDDDTETRLSQNSQGVFQAEVPYGEVTLRGTHPGYEPWTNKIRIGSDKVIVNTTLTNWKKSKWLDDLEAIEELIEKEEPHKVVAYWAASDLKSSNVNFGPYRERVDKVENTVASIRTKENEKQQKDRLLAENQSSATRRLNELKERLTDEREYISPDLNLWAKQLETLREIKVVDSDILRNDIKTVSQQFYQGIRNRMSNWTLDELDSFLKQLDLYGVSVWEDPSYSANLESQVTSRITRIRNDRILNEKLRRVELVSGALQTFEDAGNTEERIIALSKSVQVMEVNQENLDESDLERLNLLLEEYRTRLEQELEKLTEKLDADRPNRLAMLYNSQADIRRALGNDYASLWEKISTAVGQSVLIVKNKSGSNVQLTHEGKDITLAEDEEKKFIFTHEDKVIPYNFVLNQKGYRAKIIQGEISPGDFKVEMIEGELEVLPVSVSLPVVPGATIEVNEGGAWLQRDSGFEVIPPALVSYRWSKPDYQPVRKDIRIGIGEEDLVISEPNRWEPSPRLTKLEKAFSAYEQGNVERAKASVPTERMENQNIHEVMRQEVLQWLRVEKLYADGNIDKVIDHLANTPKNNSAWRNLESRVNDEVWDLDSDGELLFALNQPVVKSFRAKKLADLSTDKKRVLRNALWKMNNPVERSFTYTGSEADKLRSELGSENTTGPAALHIKFSLEHQAGLVNYEELLGNLLKMSSQWSAEDFALAAYCEQKLRVLHWNDLTKREIYTESKFIQVDKLAGETLKMIEKWEEGNNPPDFHKRTRQMIENWEGITKKVLPFWADSEAPGVADQSIQLYEIYQRFPKKGREEGGNIDVLSKKLNTFTK